VLSIGYCRVSTEEQASEGYSIEGQAVKLRQYADLHELGAVRVVADPGVSGRNLVRPGLSELRALVGSGEVSDVLVWRLDRLSRSVQDLWTLADEFENAGVGFHSLNEHIDLSSATGRMFYSILGAFAQFYREQLAENVRMGLQQALREGRHVNRAKFGYRMIDGALTPDPTEAEVVRLIFEMGAAGASYRQIEQATGVKYSTVSSILKSRVYLGEIPNRGSWLPGVHAPILTEGLWAAAQRGQLPGRRRSRHFLAGRVRCGLCGRAATVKDNGEGRPLLFHCWHRGTGCKQPARSARGLERAAVFGLQLLRDDSRLREAIRRALARDPGQGVRASRRRVASIAKHQKDQHKLLELYYSGSIGADLFGQAERRLAQGIEGLRAEQAAFEREQIALETMHQGLEDVWRVLEALDFEEIWPAATEQEKRVLVEELLESVAIFPDHLEVTAVGMPVLSVLPEEVGLKSPEGDRWCRRRDLNPHAP
jgi:site-specific DNA recombinase